MLHRAATLKHFGLRRARCGEGVARPYNEQRQPEQDDHRDDPPPALRADASQPQASGRYGRSHPLAIKLSPAQLSTQPADMPSPDSSERWRRPPRLAEIPHSTTAVPAAHPYHAKARE